MKATAPQITRQWIADDNLRTAQYRDEGYSISLMKRQALGRTIASQVTRKVHNLEHLMCAGYQPSIVFRV